MVLTHISDELDDEWAREEAARGFGGPVEVAREGEVYEVSGRAGRSTLRLPFPWARRPNRDPFANFERMRREMDELLGDVLGPGGYGAAAPQAGVRAQGRRLLLRRGRRRRGVVKVELPGTDLDAVNLEIAGAS